MSEYESVWREFEANEITHSGAHYLLAVAAFVRQGEAPRGADIARHLGVTRAAASMQLRALRDQGLLDTGEGSRLVLTETGAELVARIASKREAMRVFLTEILGIEPVTAELDACKVEHLISEETGAALVRFSRFLRSGHPAAEACRDAYGEFAELCTTESADDLVIEGCLLSMGKRPS